MQETSDQALQIDNEKSLNEIVNDILGHLLDSCESLLWLNFFSRSDNTIFYAICHSKFLLILFIIGTEEEISKNYII